MLRPTAKTSVLLLAATASFLVATTSVAAAQCAFPHPKKAARFRSSLVPAFVQCMVGINSCCNQVNAMTEGGLPACSPPETFHESAGSSSNGWLWDGRAQGAITIGAAKNKLEGPANPPGDTADLAIAATLSGVWKVTGPATGTGYLYVIARMTLQDRMGGDMMAVDFPLSFPFAVADGKGKIKTTANAVLNEFFTPMSLPGCTSLEIMAAAIVDQEGSTFAVPGIYLPDL